LQQQNDICSALEARLEMAEKVLFHCERNLQLTIQIWMGAFENVEPLLAKRADNSAEIARLIQQLREQAESEKEKELLEAASPRWSFSDNFGELLRQIVDGEACTEGGEETANVMLPLLVDHASWKAFVEFLRAEAKHAERSEESSERMIGRARELVRQNQVLKSVVAERKRLQERLSQLASIIECSNDAIVVYTLGGTIVSWNAGAKSLYGYSANEVLGRSRYMLAAPDQPDEITRVAEKLKRQEKIELCEATHVRKGGKRMRVCMSLSPVKEVNGEVVGCVAIVREISDSKSVLDSRSNKHDRKSV
jgi:PAS domain S-box-containing protein